MKIKIVYPSAFISVIIATLLFGSLHFSNPTLAYDPNATVGNAWNTYGKKLREGEGAFQYTLWLNNVSSGVPVTGTVFAKVITPDQCQISGNGSSFGTTYTATLLPESTKTTFKNWVRPIDDTLEDGSNKCFIDFSLDVSTPYYDGLVQRITFEILDNEDTVFVRMDRIYGWEADEGTSPSDKTLDGDYYMVEAYGTIRSDVVITAKTDGQCQFVNNARTAYIGTTKSWTIPHNSYTEKYQLSYREAFMLGPVDDNIIEGPHNCYVTTTVNSADSRYSIIKLPKFMMFIGDNDSAGSDGAGRVETKPKDTTPSATPQTTTKANETSDIPTELRKYLFDLSFNELRYDSTVPIQVRHGDPVILSGVAAPLSTIYLYIYSEPQEAIVTADKSGNWAYEVEGLESGGHHVEVEISDPKTRLTSPRKTIAEFSVLSAATEVATTQAANKSSKYLNYLVIAVACLVFGSVAIILSNVRLRDRVKSFVRRRISGIRHTLHRG